MTRKKAPEISSGDQRRTSIADAALEVLAAEGARGLTHRAVDQALKLPSGSTSYYFRTRNALLLAAAERLVALDLQDIKTIVGSMASPDPVEVAATVIAKWTATESRARSLARLELLLTAARDPAFEFMKQTREYFLNQLGSGNGRGAAHDAAVAQMSLIDGLVLQGLLYGGMSRSAAKRSVSRLDIRSVAPRTPRKKAAQKVRG